MRHRHALCMAGHPPHLLLQLVSKLRELGARQRCKVQLRVRGASSAGRPCARQQTAAKGARQALITVCLVVDGHRRTAWPASRQYNIPMHRPSMCCWRSRAPVARMCTGRRRTASPGPVPRCSHAPHAPVLAGRHGPSCIAAGRVRFALGGPQVQGTNGVHLPQDPELLHTCDMSCVLMHRHHPSSSAS